MTTTKHENEYYCSAEGDDPETERASWVEELSEDEYDSRSDNEYDGTYGNIASRPMTQVPEESGYPWFSKVIVNNDGEDDDYEDDNDDED